MQPLDTRDVVRSAALSTSSRPRPSDDEVDLRFAGALTFSEDGVLFVGDNHGGAIFAFEVPAGEPPARARPFSIRNIDNRVGELLGVRSGAVEINER